MNFNACFNQKKMRVDIQVWGINSVFFLIYSIIRFRRVLPLISFNSLHKFIPSFTFFLGAILAYPVISFFEAAFRLKQSLFESILFQLLLIILAVFTLTSTSPVFGKGIVLSLLFTQLLLQTKLFLRKGDISSWFGKDKKVRSRKEQYIYVFIALVAFFFLSVYFVLF